MKQPANGACGLEYLVDAYRCDPPALRSRAALEQVFARLIEDLGLRPEAQPLWHVFPAPARMGLGDLSRRHPGSAAGRCPYGRERGETLGDERRSAATGILTPVLKRCDDYSTGFSPTATIR